MADPRDESDERVSRAYRDLPGEGPPPALDAAIQAAARRAVGSRPGGMRRWQVPVSIAAVLALAIGVSLQVDREKPVVADGTPVPAGSAEYPVSSGSAEYPVSAGSTEYPVPQEEPEAARPAAGREAAPAPAVREAAPARVKREAAPAPETKQATPAPEAAPFAPEPPRAMPAAPAPVPAPAAATVAAPPAAAGIPANEGAARALPQAADRATPAPSREKSLRKDRLSDSLDTPERILERIADLRARGRHDEADRALAQFRRTHPGYRIDEEWLRKVERR